MIVEQKKPLVRHLGPKFRVFAPLGHTEGHPPLDHFGEGLRRMLLTSWHLDAALPDLPVACLQRL